MTATDGASVELESARSYTRWFLAIVLLGLATSSAVALVADPLLTFGTGRVRPITTDERDDKTDLFLAAPEPPQAIVLGSSRVYKARPACVQELTGYRAFNFGFGFAKVDDMIAITRFVLARGKAPLREIVMGLDVEAFDDDHADQRLSTARNLRPYVDDAGLSWTASTTALFGWQDFRFGLSQLWHAARHSWPPPLSRLDADGFLTYLEWDPAVEAGTFSSKPLVDNVVKKLAGRAETQRFPRLSPSRIAMLHELLAIAKERGAQVDAFIAPLHPRVQAAEEQGDTGARFRDLDDLLAGFARDGLLRYTSIRGVTDFHGDPDGWYDGHHMTEANTARVLLTAFHRDQGCGLTLR